MKFRKEIKLWDCKPNVIETDVGKDYFNKIFIIFMELKIIERYSR